MVPINRGSLDVDLVQAGTRAAFHSKALECTRGDGASQRATGIRTPISGEAETNSSQTCEGETSETSDILMEVAARNIRSIHDRHQQLEVKTLTFKNKMSHLGIWKQN